MLLPLTGKHLDSLLKGFAPEERYPAFALKAKSRV